jgi:hypothetical protein
MTPVRASLTMSAEAPIVFATQEDKSSSLCSDFSWTFVGSAIYAGGQFATLMLLAKLLRPELVGQYALGLAVVYPVMMFTNLQLRAVLTSGTRQKIHFGNYLSLRLLTTLLAFVIIFALTQVLRYGRELTTVVLVVGLAYAIETISDVYYARLQLHDRMAEISKSMIARALLSVPALAFATYVSRSLQWAVQMVLSKRGIEPALRSKGAPRIGVAELPSRDRRTLRLFEFQHSELFHQACAWGTRRRYFRSDWIHGFGRKYGSDGSWPISVHPSSQIVR